MIKETSSQLILQDNINFSFPFFIVFIVLVILGIVPPLLPFYSIGVTTLSCQRLESQQVNCHRNESRLFSLIKLPSTSLEKVSSAKFVSKNDQTPQGEKIVTNLTKLNTSEGQVDVFQGSTEKMQDFVSKINNFLQSNEPSLTIKHEISFFWSWELLLRNWSFLFFLMVWEVSIIFCLYSCLKESKRQTFTFNKNSQILTYKLEKLLSKKSTNYTFSNIVSIEIEEEGVGDEQKFYMPKLVIEHEVNYPPMQRKDLYLKFLGSIDLQKEQEFAEKVRSFIGLEETPEVVQVQEKEND